MKKLSILLFFVLTIITPLLSCEKQEEFSLYNYVTEERIDIGFGESEKYKLKCNYGYITENDVKIYSLTFILQNIIDDTISYNISFSLNEKNYSGIFTFSPTLNAVSYSTEIDQTVKVFPLTITIKQAQNSEILTLNSIIPTDIKNVKEALASLYLQQKTYIDSFFVEDKFNGKLTVRVVEKDKKGYYYVGFEDKNGKLKAMLIDGTNLSLLAIREVF